MKGYDLFIAVGQVEDRFIEESEQEQSLKAETKRVYSTWIKCGAAAACLLVCLIGLSVWKKNGNVSEREVVNCYTGENTEYYEKNTQEDSANTGVFASYNRKRFYFFGLGKPYGKNANLFPL